MKLWTREIVRHSPDYDGTSSLVRHSFGLRPSVVHEPTDASPSTQKGTTTEQETNLPVPLLLAPSPYQDEADRPPETGDVPQVSSPVPSPPPPPPIIVIDPGKVSGIAVLHPGALIPTNKELDVPGTVREYLIWAGDDTDVVMESFQISERTIKTALSLDALDLIGYVKLDRMLLSYSAPVMQTPAQAKRFATDDKLKALGWYHRTPDGHINDANRHLLVYLANNYREWFNHWLLPAIVSTILPPLEDR